MIGVGGGGEVLMATRFVIGQAVKSVPSRVVAAGAAVVMRTLLEDDQSQPICTILSSILYLFPVIT